MPSVNRLIRETLNELGFRVKRIEKGDEKNEYIVYLEKSRLFSYAVVKYDGEYVEIVAFVMKDDELGGKQSRWSGD